MTSLEMIFRCYSEPVIFFLFIFQLLGTVAVPGWPPDPQHLGEQPVPGCPPAPQHRGKQQISAGNFIMVYLLIL